MTLLVILRNHYSNYYMHYGLLSYFVKPLETGTV